MILRSITASATVAFTLLSLTLQLSAPVSAKKDEPKVSRTKFDAPLANLFYFEDSDIVVGHDRESSTVWRSPDGGETWEIIDANGQKNHAWDIWPHPHDHSRAYILGTEHKHWKTDDRGKTWSSFETKAVPSAFREPFSFHGRDSKRVIFHGQLCEGWICDEHAFITDDDFKTLQPLRSDARGCTWAVSTPQFGQDSDALDIIDKRIFCIVRNPFSAWSADNRFVVSDNYFIEEKEVVMSSGRAVTGVINTAPVKSYLVAAAKAELTDEMALYVTHDASTWHKAEFGPHKVEQDAYTILESTNYSLQLDVMTTKPTSAMGVLFTSNSNGTYFTRNIEHTNRALNGFVDFEKISGIQGIVLVNTVSNWKKVEKTSLSDKEVQSSISFDDGRTFQDLKAGDKRLHLHSVSDLSNTGRVFSSPAPGIVMGVGNTGDHLKDYEDGDLYVSDDAGVTWRKALDKPHKYEFGDQGSVLVAVGEGKIKEIQYSINHGRDWKKVELEDEVVPKMFTTTPDSTSLKFLLLATGTGKDESKWLTYALDFEGLHERKCGDDDFEKWPARVGEDGKPSCVMGHKQFYRRRKWDADCFIESDFKDPIPEFEKCECTDADFECDFNFVRSEDRKECVAAGPVQSPQGECKDSKDSFKASSGWRLIPGNECKRKDGKQLDDPVERPCSESGTKPSSGEIESKKTDFKSEMFAEYYYLERTKNSQGSDETIIMRTSSRDIHRSKDHGKSWERILEDEEIETIWPHRYFNDVVYFLTKGKKVWYTIDRAATFHSFEAPDPPNVEKLPPISFHPDYKDWLIWTGAANCPGDKCQTKAHYTTDRGDTWSTLLRSVRRCEFIKDPQQGQGPKDDSNKQLVYCEQYENENPKNPLQLHSSRNWFADRETPFTNILDFAVMYEFIIVAARAEDAKTLKVDASVDGSTFADAKFPANFQVDHQQAYTVLDSSTHAVFLHVTVNNEPEHEHGSIIKSNSNGTSYSMSLNAVNRDTLGYVDFEKMQGLEGVAMVNVVANVDKNDKKGEKKKLKTMITHNDGAEWSLIVPPSRSMDGTKFKCNPNGKATDKCALHLHSYTERDDKQATFGSASAIGMMLAVGNVGEQLVPKTEDDTFTFITRDGGMTWKAIRKGNFIWEYGDQGSVIVIVEKRVATTVVYYTLDEGEVWNEYAFSDVKMKILSISTVPSDNALNFLLWGHEEGKKTFSTVNIDFSGLKEREHQCNLDESHPENKDYVFWQPKHPLQKDDCLFGHKARYHRKRIEADCRNGPLIEQLHSFAENCTCTRQDFECDYNYERQADGSCNLVPGLPQPDHSLICKEDSSAVEFYEPTGYRRIPLTTCQGGRELDKDRVNPCPNRLGDFNKKYGLSGAALFFAIVTPIAVAAGVGYWVWREYTSGRLQGFGQIRLGESDYSADGENPFVKIPINIIAGTWAIIQASPLLAMSLWRSAKGYFPVAGGSGGSGRGWARGAFGGGDQPYRSRASFAAARRDRDFESVVEDEDELLGEEDLEDGEGEA